MARVPVGQFGDQVMAFLIKNKDEPLSILAWSDRNNVALKEYWARDKSGALEVKKALEQYEAMRPKPEAAE